MCVFQVPEECPKVLINMQNTAENGFDFDDAEKFPERLILKGKSQVTIQEIAEACGWNAELTERKVTADATHDLARKLKMASEEEGEPDQVDELAKKLEGLDV